MNSFTKWGSKLHNMASTFKWNCIFLPAFLHYLNVYCIISWHEVAVKPHYIDIA